MKHNGENNAKIAGDIAQSNGARILISISYSFNITLGIARICCEFWHVERTLHALFQLVLYVS